MRFIIRCAWCNKYMGEKVIGEDSEEPVITHSMCPQCRAKIEEEIKEYIRNMDHAEN